MEFSTNLNKKVENYDLLSDFVYSFLVIDQKRSRDRPVDRDRRIDPAVLYSIFCLIYIILHFKCISLIS